MHQPGAWAIWRGMGWMHQSGARRGGMDGAAVTICYNYTGTESRTAGHMGMADGMAECHNQMEAYHEETMEPDYPYDRLHLRGWR